MIVDERHNTVMLIGQDGDDLAFGVRMRATIVKLRNPLAVLDGGLSGPARRHGGCGRGAPRRRLPVELPNRPGVDQLAAPAQRKLGLGARRPLGLRTRIGDSCADRAMDFRAPCGPGLLESAGERHRDRRHSRHRVAALRGGSARRRVPPGALERMGGGWNRRAGRRRDGGRRAGRHGPSRSFGRGDGSHPMTSRPVGRYERALPIVLLALLSCNSGDGPGNRAPTAVISLPAAGTLFSGGDTIHFAGGGTDPEDGPLAAEPPHLVGGPSPRHPHSSVSAADLRRGERRGVCSAARTHGRQHLSPHQSRRDRRRGGSRHHVRGCPATKGDAVLCLRADRCHHHARRSAPRDTASASLASSAWSVISARRLPRSVAADSLEWQSWSDAGAALHTVVTPTVNATYTATYQVVAIVNQHPIVNITAPAPGATITQGTLSSITATASDPDGTIANVEFFDGTASLGIDNTFAVRRDVDAGHTGRAHPDRARHGQRRRDDHLDSSLGHGGAGRRRRHATDGATHRPDGRDAEPGRSRDAHRDRQRQRRRGRASLFQVDGVSLSEDLTAPYQATVPSTERLRRRGARHPGPGARRRRKPLALVGRACRFQRVHPADGIQPNHLRERTRRPCHRDGVCPGRPALHCRTGRRAPRGHERGVSWPRRS